MKEIFMTQYTYAETALDSPSLMFYTNRILHDWVANIDHCWHSSIVRDGLKALFLQAPSSHTKIWVLKFAYFNFTFYFSFEN